MRASYSWALMADMASGPAARVGVWGTGRMKSLFQSFGYARRKSKAKCRAQFRGENHRCARTSSFVVTRRPRWP